MAPVLPGHDEHTGPAIALEVITNDARALPFFKSILRELRIPGEVVVRPFPWARPVSYLFSVISPCQLTPEQRRAAERKHPGLNVPDEGRLPSRRDFEAAFATHPEWQVKFDQGTTWWTASIRSSGESASIYVGDSSGDPTREHRFYFDGGDPALVVEIVAALAERCSSFLVVGEGGDIVVMVNPDGSRSDVGETPVGRSVR